MSANYGYSSPRRPPSLTLGGGGVSFQVADEQAAKSWLGDGISFHGVVYHAELKAPSRRHVMGADASLSGGGGGAVFPGLRGDSAVSTCGNFSAVQMLLALPAAVFDPFR